MSELTAEEIENQKQLRREQAIRNGEFPPNE